MGAFLTLSDLDGLYEMAVFAESYERAAEWLKVGQTLSIETNMTWRQGELRFSARTIRPFDYNQNDHADMTKEEKNEEEKNEPQAGDDTLEVIVAHKEGLAHLKEMTTRLGAGGVRIILRLEENNVHDRGACIQLPQRYAIDEGVVQGLRHAQGIKTARFVQGQAE